MRRFAQILTFPRATPHFQAPKCHITLEETMLALGYQRKSCSLLHQAVVTPKGGFSQWVWGVL